MIPLSGLLHSYWPAPLARSARPLRSPAPLIHRCGPAYFAMDLDVPCVLHVYKMVLLSRDKKTIRAILFRDDCSLVPGESGFCGGYHPSTRLSEQLHRQLATEARKSRSPVMSNHTIRMIAPATYSDVEDVTGDSAESAGPLGPQEGRQQYTQL